MSLTSILLPTLPTFSTTSRRTSTSTTDTLPFTHQPTYISLTRQLTRYQHILLLPPSPSDQTHTLTQRDLHSPLPYHRTKWLHNIEHCRTQLLQLEHDAQSIKIQSQKRAAVHDLAEKRMIIKKLRRHIEDVGREVEAASNQRWHRQDDDEEGETLEQILGRPLLQKAAAKPSSPTINRDQDPNSDLTEGKTVRFASEEPTSSQSTRDALFTTSASRRRRGQSPGKEATTSGFSSLPGTESTLSTHDRTHETLTTSLVSLASQLKAQSLTFQSTLSTSDQSYLDKALSGLDKNITTMASASKNIAFLRRMSEGQGWLGRMKLYAMIFGLWIVAFMLVFVGPKLRF